MQLRDEFNDMPDQEFEIEYELLYTIYAFPNIILPFFGGMLVRWWWWVVGRRICIALC